MSEVTPVDVHKMEGVDIAVAMPSGWAIAQPAPLVTTALEPVGGILPSTVTILVDRAQRQLLPEPEEAAGSLLVLPMVLWVDRSKSGTAVDVLLCHLAGTVSVTALQRQCVTQHGLVVVTVTVATARWGRYFSLARQVVDSIRDWP